METRNVKITLDKAKEWYKQGGDLKQVALQAFKEEELKEFDFRSIKTFEDAVKALNLNEERIKQTLLNLGLLSKASVASFKLNLIRKALNKRHKMSFTEGRVYYPYNPIVLPDSGYCKPDTLVEIAKIKIEGNTFTLFGGAHYWSLEGLAHFDSCYGVGAVDASVGFLGCATKEIAQHFGRYFAKEIFEAKYGDLIEYEWV